MEQELLQFIGVFVLGAIVGVVAMLAMNKVRSGSASPSKVKEEYDAYQAEVEAHFEETSKKFKDMTARYQDLYAHLSVGATSLCRPDSVAAALADESDPMQKPAQLEKGDESVVEEVEAVASEESPAEKNIEEKPNSESGTGESEQESSSEIDSEPESEAKKEESA